MPIRVRKTSALPVIGLLERRGQTAVSVEQMNDAVAAAAVERHVRSLQFTGKPSFAIQRKQPKSQR